MQTRVHFKIRFDREDLHNLVHNTFMALGMITAAAIVLWLAIMFVDTTINFMDGYKKWKAEHEIVADYGHEVYQLSSLQD